jgi:DNA-binding GntR family transcriptional regulator
VSEIDPYGPVPLFRQLADVLRGKIERGELEPGRPVPSQRSLVQEYGLARGTVARAVAMLVEEGLVVIVPGKGAYVPPRRS